MRFACARCSAVHLRPDVRNDRRRDQEDRRRRQGNPSAQRRRDHRERNAAGNKEKNCREVRDLGHSDATPTRLPGTPSLNLASLDRARRRVPQHANRRVRSPAWTSRLLLQQRRLEGKNFTDDNGVLVSRGLAP